VKPGKTERELLYYSGQIAVDIERIMLSRMQKPTADEKTVRFNNNNRTAANKIAATENS